MYPKTTCKSNHLPIYFSSAGRSYFINSSLHRNIVPNQKPLSGYRMTCGCGYFIKLPNPLLFIHLALLYAIKEPQTTMLQSMNQFKLQYQN